MPSRLILTLCCFPIVCLAQPQQIINQQATHFSIQSPEDTIDFILVDTSLTQTKPVFLFCQGSLPVPLFTDLEQQGMYMFGGGINNFDYKKLVETYHLVVISMPHTPLVVPQSHLNPQYQYVPDPEQPRQFSAAYIEDDFLNNYVHRGIKVLEYLKEQEWVDRSRLVVAGHSQGSKVATKIAIHYPSVTHLGLFAANPLGRADQYVRQARLDAQLGNISWERADSIMQDQYDFFQSAHQKDSLAKYPHLNSWRTFSEPFYDDWLKLDIPIFLAYGTEDRTADICDLIPLFFIQAGKKNLTLQRYLHMEHNFFEVDADGSTNYDNAHWPEVMEAFREWVERG